MVSLLLATAFSAMLSIMMRAGNGKVRSKIAMLAYNYLVCMVLTGLTIGFGGNSWTHSGMPRVLGMGVINGVFYVAALIVMQYNIPRNGIVLPSVFSKTGALMVPLVLSIILFGEMPGVWQFVGAVLAVAGILLMNYRKGSMAGSMAALLVLALTEGMASSMSKIYREVGVSDLSDHFLFITFTVAFLICIFLIVKQKDRFGLPEAIFGILIGVPNFFGSRIILTALEQLPAIIVYPFRSVASLVLVTLAGLFLFRERLSKRQLIAMVVILAALALLNL